MLCLVTNAGRLCINCTKEIKESLHERNKGKVLRHFYDHHRDDIDLSLLLFHTSDVPTFDARCATLVDLCPSCWGTCAVEVVLNKLRTTIIRL